MIVTLISILLSLLYIVIHLLAGNVVDVVFVPVVYWSVALSMLELFVLTASISTPLFFLSVPALLWIMSQWIGLVASAVGNKKMKENYDEFVKELYPIPILKKIVGPIYDAFVYVYDQIKKTWFLYIDLLKTIWNNVITILGLIVTLGGAVDEDLAPPLPGKFITAQMINDGKFWKIKGRSTIYWSEDKDKLSETETFKNTTEYSNFRESYGLSEDSRLGEVEEFKIPIIKFSF